jgi:hypothetical protein
MQECSHGKISQKFSAQNCNCTQEQLSVYLIFVAILRKEALTIHVSPVRLCFWGKRHSKQPENKQGAHTN